MYLKPYVVPRDRPLTMCDRAMLLFVHPLISVNVPSKSWSISMQYDRTGKPRVSAYSKSVIRIEIADVVLNNCCLVGAIVGAFGTSPSVIVAICESVLPSLLKALTKILYCLPSRPF